MINGINRKEACLNCMIKNKSGNDKSGQSDTCRIIKKAELSWIIAIVFGAALFVSAGPAFGQFTVQPMQVELSVTPNKIVKSELIIQSFDPNEAHDITLSVVEMSQAEDGAWQIIEPNDITDPNSPSFGFDISKLSSCKDWISLNPDTFNLSPNQRRPVEVTLQIRRGVRGFFGAAIVAKTSPMQGFGDVSVVVRFVVPVILEIQDRPMRPRVQATDIGLEFIEQTGDYPAMSLATMDIENTGGTFSRVRPAVRILSYSDEHWRVITTTDFHETGIIPGVKLKLKANIRKDLPSGRYKLAGYLFVDGRRMKKIEKEMDFVGDTRVTNVASDAPIDLRPPDLVIDGLPGATRMSAIKVYNASQETVNVQVAMGLQSVLSSNTIGDVKGEDLDCTGWLKVTPEQFTLRGEGGVQTLRIVNTMPKTEAIYPYYYSLLALWASYPDGQKAGYSTANICIRNTTVDAQPAVVALKLVPQDLGDSQYLVVSKFGNFGLSHVTPIRVKAGLVLPSGIHRVSTFLWGTVDMMLPSETRDFTGVLDLTNIPPDIYQLAVAMEYAPGEWAEKQMAVRVSTEGDRRVLNVIGVEEELGELVKIQW